MFTLGIQEMTLFLIHFGHHFVCNQLMCLKYFILNHMDQLNSIGISRSNKLTLSANAAIERPSLVVEFRNCSTWFFQYDLLFEPNFNCSSFPLMSHYKRCHFSCFLACLVPITEICWIKFFCCSPTACLWFGFQIWRDSCSLLLCWNWKHWFHNSCWIFVKFYNLHCRKLPWGKDILLLVCYTLLVLSLIA